MKHIVAVCGVALFVLAASASCVVESRPAPVVVKTPGPPAHAPAHGYRRHFVYVYYPSAFVYFDIERKVYFYRMGGSWRMVVHLPAAIHIDAHEGVSLSLDTDKPYRDFDAHRKAYPPRRAEEHGPPPGHGPPPEHGRRG